MLKELQLKNFLSYESAKITFPENATIAVVGENGHGKSSMLEAISFALFGEGRTSLSGMVRNKSKGGMKVVLTLSDTPNPGGEMRVERGVRASGSGYTKVWADDVLMAQGGAAGSSKAQDYIDLVLGTDRDTFFLTSFFGLGGNDKLMLVQPSQRLDTMQKLAGTEVCQKFADKANARLKEYAEQSQELQTTIATLREIVEDPKDIQVNLEKSRKRLEALKEEREELYTERNGLLKDEDRYRKLIHEKEVLASTRNLTERGLEKGLKQLQKYGERLREAREASKEVALQKREYTTMLANNRTADEVRAEWDECVPKRATFVAWIDLRETAIKESVSGEGDCPLCGAKLEGHSVDRWQREINTIGTQATRMTHKIDLLKKELDAIRTMEKNLENTKRALKSTLDEVDMITEEGKAKKKETDSAKAELTKADARLLKISNELSTYGETMNRIHEIDEALQIKHTEIGSEDRNIIQLKKELTEQKDRLKLIKAKEKIRAEIDDKAQAFKLVKDGFSRYAIPVQLLRKLRDAIERRASRIYQEFGAGLIRIIDTEGARPGIEFVLEDENGQREYKVLSAGEKVMVFISIRIALTDIVRKARDNRVNFLILDEVAGNLDPGKREDLTRLINKLLRTYFPQVFMVSHVALRDIFNTTLRVRKQGGVSAVSKE